VFFIIFFQHIFVLFIVSTLVSCFSFFFSRGEWSGATTCKLYDGEKKDKGNDLLSLSVV